MNELLERAWRRGGKPFHGDTLFLPAAIDLTTLTYVSAAIFRFLCARFREAPLYVVEDWHEHDGWLLEAKPVDRRRLLRILEPPERLAEFCALDDLVYRAIYPDDLELLWRIGREADHYFEKGRWRTRAEPHGRFDLSASPELIAALRRAVPDLGELRLEVMRSKPFFDRRYAG